MDISKYLINKDIQLSNDDINIEKLEKDIRKGFVSSEEVDKAREEALKESTASYSKLEQEKIKLENTVADYETRNTELTKSNKEANLKVEMVSQGFKKEVLDEVAQLRNSLFAEEQDDAKAISMIKEKYSATYFPVETEKKVEIPEETKFAQPVKKSEDINITRRTSIKDLIIK